MIIPDNLEARSAVFTHISVLEKYPGFKKPEPEMWGSHDEILDQNIRNSVKTNRSAIELAHYLRMSEDNFRAIFLGRSVLDIGCGEGLFDTQIATDKHTHVTALDNDPKMLANIEPKPNLSVVEGSGYDLEATLGHQEFDVVLTAFSSLTWARNALQAKLAIESAIRVTKEGGNIIFIPFMQYLKSHEAYHGSLARISVGDDVAGNDTAKDNHFISDSVLVEDWMRFIKLRTLRAAEDSGRITCSFVESDDNFSVVVTVLEK